MGTMRIFGMMVGLALMLAGMTSPALARWEFVDPTGAIVQAHVALPDEAVMGHDRRMQIEAVQKALSIRGYDPGRFDGRLGSKTRRAIRAYQAAVGLPVDGQVTPYLLDHLRAALPGMAVVMYGPVDQVTEAQVRLIHLGYYTGKVDGRLGKMTRRAISQFQKNQGYRVTGRVDGALLSALRGTDPLPYAEKKYGY